jgi:hypothetical protein
VQSIVTDATHPMPARVRDPGRATNAGNGGGKPEAGQRWHDDVEPVGRIAAVGGRMPTYADV